MMFYDIEHSKNVNQDSRRIYQLLKSSVNAEDHPFGKFGTGNKDTLAGPQVRSHLLAFHDKYYSANIMRLCVSGVGKHPRGLNT